MMKKQAITRMIAVNPFFINYLGDKLSKALDYTDQRKKQNYRTDNSVYQPHRAQIEVCSDFIDKVCHYVPPKVCTNKDEQEAGDIMVESIVGIHEIKSGEKADYKE